MRNSTVRHQRLLVRFIHSSGKSSEGEPARLPDERPRTGYQGLSNRLPVERPRGYQGPSSRSPDERARAGYQGLSSRPPDERLRTAYQGPSSRLPDERPRTGYQGLSSRSLGERPSTGYQGFSNRLPDERSRVEHQGFFKRPPAVIRDPDGKWGRDNHVSMGTSGIDSAILSSFGPSGANWPRGSPASASAPPRIDRATNYRHAGAAGSGTQVDSKPIYSGDRYRSPPFRPQTGYKPQTDEASRWRSGDAQASKYTGLPTPVGSGYQSRDAMPAWRQQGARTWQSVPGQDDRGGGYGTPGGSSPQRSGTQDGYQPQEMPQTEAEKPTLRPAEYVNNEYERRRAGKVRDKTRAGRGFDEFESAILGDEVPQQDKKAARRAMRAKKRENREETPKMIPLFLPEYISVPNLAKALKIRLDDFLRQMKQMGFTDMSHDHILNAETAGLIAMEYNYEPIADRSAERDLLPRYVPSIPSRNRTSNPPKPISRGPLHPPPSPPSRNNHGPRRSR